VIASVAAMLVMPERRILEVSADAGGAKGSERCLGYRTLLGAKAAPYSKKCIVLAIGALAALSPDGIEESSPHHRAPEVHSKAEPPSPSVELQARSATTSGP
jgi:hypothetical protein